MRSGDYHDTWERLELGPEEIIDTVDELIVFVHEVARGRKRRVVQVRNYLDRKEALEAAELRE